MKIARRIALVLAVTFNVVLLVVHFFMLGLLLTQVPDIIGFSGESDVAATVVAPVVIYLLPFAISFGLWLAGRSRGFTILVRAQVFTTAAFYLTVLACVVVCRVNGIWIDIS